MKRRWSLSHDTVNKHGNTHPGGEEENGAAWAVNTGKKSYYNVGNYCQTELSDKIEGGVEKQIESVLSLDVGWS